MADSFDPRSHPIRPDLAATRYRGQVDATAFVDGAVRVVAAPQLAVRSRPVISASYASELLFGEAFETFEVKGGWAWGQSLEDGYVGYVKEGGLGREDDPAVPPTHRVAVPLAHVYPLPDIKTPPLATLPFGALLPLPGETDGKFMALADGGWIYAAHVAPLDSVAPDLVGTALMFRDCPYLWGGRTAGGLDCSALVQLALGAAGLAAPRDSDLQMAWLADIGLAVDPGLAQKGDIIFWPGHVGIALGDCTVLHANAFHMRVTADPIETVTARVEADRGRASPPAYFRAPV